MPHHSDKRSSLITLSDSGLAIIDDVTAHFEHKFEQMVEYIGLEDTKHLNRVLNKMIAFCELTKGENDEKKEQ